MKYLNGKEFNPRDYVYGAWLTDPFVKIWRCIFRLEHVPIAQIYVETTNTTKKIIL